MQPPRCLHSTKNYHNKSCMSFKDMLPCHLNTLKLSTASVASTPQVCALTILVSVIVIN